MARSQFPPLARRAAWTFALAIGLAALARSLGAHAMEPGDGVVYSVSRALDLGGGEPPPPKDFYVNLGAAQGLQPGSRLTVRRRVSTYDLAAEKLYKDVTFSIATLRVIHVERNIAIARLDRFTPQDTTPSLSPRAVMIGDQVEAQ